MEMLDLLWDLELHQQSLKKYFAESIKLENNQVFAEHESLLNEKEKKLIILKERQKALRIRLEDMDIRIKDSRLKVMEIEDSLYNSNSQDFKQLQILENEKNKILKIIQQEEADLLELLIEAEDLDHDLVDLENLLEETRLLYQEKVKKFELVKAQLKIKVEEDRKQIEELESHIDEKLLAKFYQIRKGKRRGIVKIKNNICTGCNLQISYIQLDKLKNNNEIILCDNCGRILYNKN